jgi:hypothetical protein
MVEAVGRITDDEALEPGEVQRRLYRLIQGAALQQRRSARARSELARTLEPSLADIDPIPYATIEQARRLAQLRASLLRTGALTTTTLAEAKGITANNARQWIARNRRAGRLFTVTHDGESLVPAFLLDEQLEPRAAAQPVIGALREAGEDGWALWGWFGSPTSWLGGRVPAEVLLTEPEVVVEAARQRAAAAA